MRWNRSASGFLLEIVYAVADDVTGAPALGGGAQPGSVATPSLRGHHRHAEAWLMIAKRIQLAHTKDRKANQTIHSRSYQIR